MKIMLVNWLNYVDHIYVLGNGKSSEYMQYLNNMGITENMYTYMTYKHKLCYSDYKSLKYITNIEAIKDAGKHNYKSIFILQDEITFINISSIESLLTTVADKKYVVFNYKDVECNCVYMNKEVIDYIASKNFNYSNQYWKLKLDKEIDAMFGQLHLSKDIVKHNIDYIVSYVDGNDPEWAAEYNKYSEEATESYNRANRWNANDVLFKTHINNLNKYMPWLNKVYLIVSSESQVPAWIDRSYVTVVLHKDIIPAEFLPTFNSRTIEMFLHNIPGLSEYFIYANDDMITLQNVKASDFFRDGKLSFEIKQNTGTKNYNITCTNNINLLKQEMKINSNFRCVHAPHPMLLSSCKHIYGAFKNKIHNSITRFRKTNNYNQYLWSLFDYYAGNFVTTDVKSKYIEFTYYINTDSVIKDAAKDNKFLCINDNTKTEVTYGSKNTDIDITHSEKIIVSLTSYPARIKYVNTVLKSILIQNVPKDLYHIVLVLAEPEFTNKEADLPEDLVETINKYNIEVIWYYRNIRSHKKLMPTLTKYPNNPILIIDDDVERPQGWLRMFIEDHIKYPNDIISGTFIWTFGRGLKLKRFTDVKGVKMKTFNGVANQLFYASKPANGFGGTLYPINTFTDSRFFDEELMMNLSPTSDETWQYCFNVIEHRNLRQTSTVIDYSKYFIDDSQKVNTSLYKINGKNYGELNNILFEAFPEFKHNLKNNRKKVIVSLTSHGDRVSVLYNTIESLLNQTHKPYKIVLTLSKEDAKLLDNKMLSLVNNNIIELITVEQDLGPHTKYYYTMQKYKDYAIITVDDDHAYTEDLVETLYKSYCDYPNCISARRVHKIRWDDNGNLLPYKKWGYQCNTITVPSFDLFATGVGGVLYPPNILQIETVNMNDIENCKFADDIYLKWRENQLNIPVVWFKNDNVEGYKFTEALYINTALYKQNCNNKRNDNYLKIFKLNKYERNL